MKKLLSFTLTATLLTAPVLTAVPAAAATGVIERACRMSDRPAATSRLCGCIQSVANQSLNYSERRKVAKWFDDPHQAQKVRMSDRDSDEALWLKYKAFGEKARATCN